MKKQKKVKKVKKAPTSLKRAEKTIAKGTLDGFFKAENIALIGASHEQNKIGNVLMKNLLKNKTVFPVNPNIDVVMNRHSFKSVLEIEDKIDLAIIAVKAEFVPEIIEECGKKKIKNVLIITSGFSEIGNEKLNEQLKAKLEKYNIKCIGPNCLGIYDSYSELDAIFLSQQRLKRPQQGKISFITQSGALGGAMLDHMSEVRMGISKFISYGNALNLDECDFLEYLGDDENTSVICLYVEQIKNGKRFLEIAKEITKKKPLIIFKGGVTEEGNKAALSHTGSLAGDSKIYEGIFRQVKAIQVENLEDLFSVANLFEKFQDVKKGEKVQVITNGGGYGIICSDQLSKNGMKMAEFSGKTKEKLKKELPPIINIGNPMDLMGDVTNSRYKLVLDNCLEEPDIGAILLVVLYQTPLINEDIVDVISEAYEKKKKPILVIIPKNSEENIVDALEEKGIVCFDFPEDAIRALKKFL